STALRFPPAPPTAIHTPSLHDALPISVAAKPSPCWTAPATGGRATPRAGTWPSRSTDSAISPGRQPSGRPSSAVLTASATTPRRSEEHTSELQSRGHLVCRLLLEKKKP